MPNKKGFQPNNKVGVGNAKKPYTTTPLSIRIPLPILEETRKSVILKVEKWKEKKGYK